MLFQIAQGLYINIDCIEAVSPTAGVVYMVSGKSHKVSPQVYAQLAKILNNSMAGKSQKAY